MPKEYVSGNYFTEALTKLCDLRKSLYTEMLVEHPYYFDPIREQLLKPAATNYLRLLHILWHRGLTDQPVCSSEPGCGAIDVLPRSGPLTLWQALSIACDGMPTALNPTEVKLDLVATTVKDQRYGWQMDLNNTAGRTIVTAIIWQRQRLYGALDVAAQHSDGLSFVSEWPVENQASWLIKQKTIDTVRRYD